MCWCAVKRLLTHSAVLTPNGGSTSCRLRLQMSEISRLIECIFRLDNKALSFCNADQPAEWAFEHVDLPCIAATCVQWRCTAHRQMEVLQRCQVGLPTADICYGEGQTSPYFRNLWSQSAFWKRLAVAVRAVLSTLIDIVVVKVRQTCFSRPMA